MIKTNKDLTFILIISTWLLSNILSYIFYGSTGICISNLLFIILFGIMIIVKNKNDKFNNWLETKI